MFSIYTKLTHLVVRKDPADCPDSCRCPYNTIQSNLPYLNESYSLGRGVDYKVVEYILICVDEERVCSSECDANDR